MTAFRYLEPAAILGHVTTMAGRVRDVADVQYQAQVARELADAVAELQRRGLTLRVAVAPPSAPAPPSTPATRAANANAANDQRGRYGGAEANAWVRAGSADSADSADSVARRATYANHDLWRQLYEYTEPARDPVARRTPAESAEARAYAEYVRRRRTSANAGAETCACPCHEVELREIGDAPAPAALRCHCGRAASFNPFE